MAPQTDTRLRVLFIADRVDAPFRYRCLHPCLQLREEGVCANIQHIDEVMADHLTDYSVVVLFRLPWDARVQALISFAKKRNISVVFDIDDLIFDPRIIRSLPFWDTVSLDHRAKYIELSTRLGQTFRACDYFIGATPQLAAAAKARGKEAFVHPNLVHPGLMRSAPTLRHFRNRFLRSPVLSYLSGSATHDRDFMKIAPVVRRVLGENPEAKLLLGGFVDIGRFFDDRDPQIIRLPFVDWQVLPWVQSLAWVNLAPLAQLNHFSHSKSALKFFEAAAARVPTVATPSDEMRCGIRHGVNSFLAETLRDWYECVTECLDWEKSQELGEAAFQTAEAMYSFGAYRGALRTHLESLVQSSWSEIKAPPQLIVQTQPEEVDPILRSGRRGKLSQKISRLRSVAGIVRKARHPEKLHTALPRRHSGSNEHWTALDVSLKEFLHESSVSVYELPPPDPQTLRESHSKWEIAWQLQPSTSRPGAWESLGTDPCMLGPAEKFDPKTRRFLWLDLCIWADVPRSMAQLYWLSDSSPHYSEECSVSFPVICDGMRRSYLIDLERAMQGYTGASLWSKSGEIHRLRFDPIQCPGTFRVYRLAFIGPELFEDGDRWGSTGMRPLVDELASAYLAGEGICFGAGKYLNQLPSTAEILRVDSGGKPPMVDFCLLQCESGAEMQSHLDAALSSLRPWGVVLGVWEDTATNGAPVDIPAGTNTIERYCQVFGDKQRHVLVLGRGDA